MTVNPDFYCSMTTLITLSLSLPVIVLIMFHGDLAPYARIDKETKKASTVRKKKSLKKNKKREFPGPQKTKSKNTGTATDGAKRC